MVSGSGPARAFLCAVCVRPAMVPPSRVDFPPLFVDMDGWMEGLMDGWMDGGLKGGMEA